jgi:hypothetical protein
MDLWTADDLSRSCLVGRAKRPLVAKDIFVGLVNESLCHSPAMHLTEGSCPVLKLLWRELSTVLQLPIQVGPFPSLPRLRDGKEPVLRVPQIPAEHAELVLGAMESADNFIPSGMVPQCSRSSRRVHCPALSSAVCGISLHFLNSPTGLPFPIGVSCETSAVPTRGTYTAAGQSPATCR